MPDDPDAARATVAAFDFDGTITRRDSLLPYLRRLVGAQRLYTTMTRQGYDLAAMLAGRVERDAVKERLLGALLPGVPAERARELGRSYSTELVRPARLRAEVLARVREHAAAGHTLVVVSASPTVYLEPTAAALGFDAVLATELEVDEQGLLTGRLVGRNCRGPEKVTRLEAWLGGRPSRVYAYGDSAGDAELLARADVGHRVGRRPLPALDA